MSVDSKKLSKQIKKGTNLLVVSGSAKGSSGKCLSVNRANNTVKISGIKLAKKHLKIAINQNLQL